MVKIEIADIIKKFTQHETMEDCSKSRYSNRTGFIFSS